MKIKLKDNLKIKGRFKIKTFKAGTKELLRETDWIDNLIVLNEDHGLHLVLKRLLGIVTYDLEITKAKIGDDDTAPDSADTDLVSVKVDNILVAQRQQIAVDEINIIFFISDDDLPDGSYKEFGIFCTNQLFARSLIVPTHTKSSGEDTQIDYTITTTNA